VPGPSLHELLAGAPDRAVVLCTATRTALAALRRANASGLARYTVDDEVAVLERWTADADARTGADLTAATGPVATALRALPDRDWAPCHRDLHDKQVIATGAGGGGPAVGLIDLDTLAAADPALDLANLLAHLHLRVLQGRCSAAVAQRCAQQLLDPAVNRAALRAFAASALLRLAAVYSVRPGPPDIPRRLSGLVHDPVPSTWSTP
jgi:aminoglycoside phosphotransferase (APT) family kinase protein